MVQISPVQAQTISAEAAAYISGTNPLAIPGPVLTQQVADDINAQLESVNRPFLDGLRRNLRLRVQDRVVDGVPVARIRPRKIHRSRLDVAGIWVHGGGFALLDARDYLAYRMAHDLGIVVYSVDYRRSPRAVPRRHRPDRPGAPRRPASLRRGRRGRLLGRGEPAHLRRAAGAPAG